MSQHENHRNLKILLIAISLLATLWVQAPRLADPLRVDEDFRHIYWLNTFHEPGLFPNDQLRGETYVTIRLPWGDLPLDFSSLGYDLLFYATSCLVSPPLFSKLLPLVLMVITVWYLFEYGTSIGGREVGIVLAVGFAFLNLASSTSLSVASGLQRGFACSLMIVLLYYLHSRKPLAAAATVFASALIYPPMFLLGAAASGLSFLTLALASPTSLKIARRGIVALLVAFFVGALLIAPIALPTIQGALGPIGASDHVDTGMRGYRDVLNHARYQPGGRSPLFSVYPIIGRGGLVNKSLTAAHLVILMVLSALIYLVRGPRGSFLLAREMWCLLLASLGLFAAAWASAFLTGSFLLYLPSRYTRVGLLLFFSMFVFLNIGAAVQEGVHLSRRHRSATIWLIAGIEVAALGFIIFYPSNRAVVLGINMKWLLAPASLLLAVLGALRFGRPSASVALTSPIQTPRGRLVIAGALAFSLVVWGAYARTVSSWSTLDPPPAEREMFAFLQTLPKDVLLAGTPCSLDSVPLFAKRQILFSCEHISTDDDLMREAMDAYYAEEADAVLDFCRAHGVDYLVINRHTYSHEKIDRGWLFFEPYNQELLPLVQGRDAFALAQVPDSAKVFESGDLFVVPCTGAALQ